METKKFQSIAELSKLSSQDLQKVVNGYLSENLLSALAADSNEAIEKDAAVISAKTELEKAKKEAFYNSSDCVDDVTAVIGQIIRKVVSDLGGKYDNKTDKFDGKFAAMYSNLWTAAVDDSKKPVRIKDGKKAVVMLRTTAEIAGWLGDVAKTYLANKSDAKSKKTAKSLKDRIKAYYLGKVEIGKTAEAAILLTAGKFDLEEETVKEYIK